jgi:hypothetical protein
MSGFSGMRDRIDSILQREKGMKRANKAVITGLVIRKKKRKNNLVEDLIYDTTTFPTKVGSI